ncbi:hypothetical protein [Chamaesiphon minutus]|uniref:Uncharacterized protein n=1 Tax=Chamaesiphon minutus (strain ATCC 27169 / PCC 6605) TaxID=1173020 RepID=K9UB64_CHAP6|nr:hypothetical protein [Chamaesiphon minutus]AFY91464.1 hypothetical protein Cha6605_0158 [Chamaesiphon minutus PCC 6605]
MMQSPPTRTEILVHVAARARRETRRFSATSGSLSCRNCMGGFPARIATLRSGNPTMEARQDRQRTLHHKQRLKPLVVVVTPENELFLRRLFYSSISLANGSQRA